MMNPDFVDAPAAGDDLSDDEALSQYLEHLQVQRHVVVRQLQALWGELGARYNRGTVTAILLKERELPKLVDEVRSYNARIRALRTSPPT